MPPELFLVVVITVVAPAFDFINGFHEAANSNATGVATTVGKGMVDLDAVTPYVMLCGLFGAIVWDPLIWRWGLPTSSSHALFGGYAGAALARSLDPGVPILSGWLKTLAFMIAVYWIFRNSTPRPSATRTGPMTPRKPWASSPVCW